MSERRRGLDVPPDVDYVRESINFPRRDDPLGVILRRINGWWKALCTQHRFDAEIPELQNLGYHVPELVRNGLTAAERVVVSASFQRDIVWVTVHDNGPGIENLKEILEFRTGQGHGLREALEFADRAIVESNAKRYELSGRRVTAHSITLVPSGTRVAIGKLRR